MKQNVNHIEIHIENDIQMHNAFFKICKAISPTLKLLSIFTKHMKLQFTNIMCIHYFYPFKSLQSS